MERDQDGFLYFSEEEQSIIGVCQPRLEVAWAPRLLNELVKKTMTRRRQDLQLARCNLEDINGAEHLAASGGIDDQLAVLNDIKEKLGELAAGEIITDALEGISGIDRFCLYEK